MEFALNLAWALLALLLVKLWLLGTPSRRVSKRTQLAALAMAIVILLPVISVTDDLQALQNPAELDCCARRSHAAAHPHPAFSPVATLPPPVFAKVGIDFLPFAVQSFSPDPLVELPAMGSIQNRPPPAA